MKSQGWDVQRECLANGYDAARCTRLFACIVEEGAKLRSDLFFVDSIIIDDRDRHQPPNDRMKPPDDMLRYFTPFRIVKNPVDYVKKSASYLRSLPPEELSARKKGWADYIKLVNACLSEEDPVLTFR